MSASAQFAPGQTIFVSDDDQAYVTVEVVSCAGFGANAALRVKAAGRGADVLHVSPPLAAMHCLESDHARSLSDLARELVHAAAACFTALR